MPARHSICLPIIPGLSHGCFRHRRPQSRLLVGCCALAVSLCGTRLAPGQAAHFGGAQTTVGGGFNNPAGTAVDASGNVYVADYANNAVKEILAINGSIPASPTIRTLGSGFNGPGELALDGNGDVYVANGGDGTVKEMLAVNGSIPNSPSIVTLTSLAQPSGVAVDASNNLYLSGGCPGPPTEGTPCGFVEELLAVSGSVSPTSNVLVLPVSPSGPGGVAVDANGNVYVADVGNGRVLEILAVNGSVTLNSASRVLLSLAGPGGIAVDSSGDVFVSQPGANQVSEVLAVNGSIPNPVTSNLIRTLGMGFNFPTGVSLDPKGNLYVGDVQNDRIVEISPSIGNFGSINVGATGSAMSLVFTFDTAGTLGSTAVLSQGAVGLDFADAGPDTCTANTAFTAGQTCTVNVTFTPTVSGARFGGAVLKNSSGAAFATGYLEGLGVGPQINFPPGTQSTAASIFAPFAVAVDGSGAVYVANADSGLVYKETPNAGGYTQQGPIGINLKSAFSLAVDSSGALYIADSWGGTVYKETPTASGYTQSVVTTISTPSGVAVDGGGNVYIAASVNNSATFFKETPTPTGYIRSTFTTTGTSLPGGIALDASGDVFISDTYNGRVIKETATGGSYAQSVVASGLGQPQQLAVDGNGNVYIGDSANHVVLKETWTGSGYSQSTVANSVVNGIDQPYGVAVDGSQNVYIADSAYSRVLKLDFADPPTLTFASTTDGTNTISSSASATAQNVGNAALDLTVPTTGNNPSISAGFALDSGGGSACPLLSSASSGPTILAVNASCQLLVNFQPPSLGPTTGSLVLTDNNLNAAAPTYSSQTLLLNGTQTLPAFTLYSSVGSAGLLQGQSFPTTITITPQSGFTVDPTFTVSGLPSGVTASFSSNPASISTVATFTASDSATGEGSVTVTGTYGTQTATTHLYIAVAAVAPSLTFSPANLHMAAGGSVTTTVTLTNPAYFPVGVTLNASNLPNGVTASFSPVITTGSSVLTLTATRAASHGMTEMFVSGTTGTVTGNAILYLTVSATEGSVWFTNIGGSLSAFDLTGVPINGFPFTGGGVGTLASGLVLAFDSSGNAWIASSSGISEYTLQGVPVTTTPFTSGGISNPRAITVDGLGQVWAANANGTVSVLSNSGNAVSPATGYSGTGSTPGGIAIDTSGGVWIPSNTANTVTRILGAAAPVVPLAAGAVSGPGAEP